MKSAIVVLAQTSDTPAQQAHIVGTHHGAPMAKFTEKESRAQQEVETKISLHLLIPRYKTPYSIKK